MSEETLKLLEIQKNSMVKELIKIPKLYYAKSHFPLDYHKELLIIFGVCVKVTSCGVRRQNKIN